MGWGVDDGGAFDDTLRAVAYAGVFALVVVASPARSARSWLAGLGIGLVALSVWRSPAGWCRRSCPTRT